MAEARWYARPGALAALAVGVLAAAVAAGVPLVAVVAIQLALASGWHRLLRVGPDRPTAAVAVVAGAGACASAAGSADALPVVAAAGVVAALVRALARRDGGAARLAATLAGVTLVVLSVLTASWVVVAERPDGAAWVIAGSVALLGAATTVRAAGSSTGGVALAMAVGIAASVVVGTLTATEVSGSATPGAWVALGAATGATASAAVQVQRLAPRASREAAATVAVLPVVLGAPVVLLLGVLLGRV